MSLRVIGEGVAGPLFTQIFSASSSAGFEEAPFFVAAIISVVGLTVRAVCIRVYHAMGDSSGVGGAGGIDNMVVVVVLVVLVLTMLVVLWCWC